MSVSELRMKTVGHRRIEGSDVWNAVQQLTETAERFAAPARWFLGASSVSRRSRRHMSGCWR